VICIARILGAGGPEVGLRVAEELGYPYVDEDIVHHAAASGGVCVAELEDIARRKTFMELVLNSLAASGGVDGYMLGVAGLALPASVPPTRGRCAPSSAARSRKRPTGATRSSCPTPPHMRWPAGTTSSGSW
jgi:Cytidylate kinase-like family